MNRIEDVYGLTPVQEGIYAQYFRDKTTDLYHLYYLFSIDEGTDLSVLQQALYLAALRHPVLRTAFAVVKGVVKQVVLTDRFPTVLTRRFDAAYSQDSLETAVRAEAAQRFDPQEDALVRCTFLLFSDARFLIFHTHHLIFDGWCTSILFEDLMTYYRLLAGGETVDALKVRIFAAQSTQPTFASYVNLIRRRDSRDAQQYWKTLLENWTPVSLPKSPKPASGSNRIQQTSQTISSELLQLAETFARKHRLPLNTVLESAFALALQKHTGARDVVFNKAVSGRSFAPSGMEHTLGPMINTVPVRLRREAGLTPRCLLRQMNEQAVCANEYGFLPLSDVCRNSGFLPSAIDVLFDFGNYLLPDFRASQPIHFLKSKEQTEFPLTCILSPEGESLRLTAIYDNAVFSSFLIRSFFSSFLFVLKRLSGLGEAELDDGAALLRLLQLTPAEQELLFGKEEDGQACGGFCAGAHAPVPDGGIYDLFLAQAEKKPAQTAILFKEQRISFSELLRKVDETADCLSGFKIGVSDVVAVHLDRSPFLIIAQLAVIKLGAVFLPVDKRFPKERLQFLCRDCQVRLLISDADVSALSDVASVSPEELRSCKAGDSHASVCSGDDCYIIYTSGSTGAPKGCLLKQSGLVNFCMNNNTLAALKQNRQNVFACVNSVAFDYFIAETLLPLLNGYTVALCDETESLRQDLFLDLVGKYQINVLMTTPTRLALFYDDRANCRILQQMDCVCSSGEPLLQPLLQKIFAKSPHAAVFNPLGPSECTVWNLGGELDRNAGLAIHLGKPIANTQIYILNEYLQPVPIGVTGELCVAGVGVGGGYLNRPELTKEKFVANPFGEGRLYKTGDLAFWREDGNVVFAGRNDFQVKINGQRVELGEVEALLSALDQIDNAVVLMCRDNADRQTLCAFYTGPEEAGANLRAALGKALPQYMIPQVFVHLDAMPLTTSGKIDRHALTALPVAARMPESDFEPPQNETEQQICDAFSAVLGQKEISRNANYYDLGGTSLQLVQLMSRAPLDVLTPSDFLKDPTPAGLAKRLDAAPDTDYTYVVPLYTPVSAKGAVVLFPFAGGDAAAYTGLVAKAREKGSDVSLYFIDWPDEEEIPAIAEEIRFLTTKMSVCFYSHCAGCAVAMMLLDQLNKETPCVQYYIAGASIPPRRVLAGFNAWAHMSDDTILKTLEKAGLCLENENEAFLHGRLKQFRRQSQLCSDYFQSKTRKTNVTVTPLISRKDPFTSNYADAEARWRKVVADVKRVVLTDTPSHYFQNTDTDLLLKLFSESLSEGGYRQCSQV